LVCRKEWPSACGLRLLLPEFLTFWTWHGFLMELPFIHWDMSATGYSRVGCHKSSCNLWIPTTCKKWGCCVLCHKPAEIDT
jgi:hypothetical protein